MPSIGGGGSSGVGATGTLLRVINADLGFANKSATWATTYPNLTHPNTTDPVDVANPRRTELESVITNFVTNNPGVDAIFEDPNGLQLGTAVGGDTSLEPVLNPKQIDISISGTTVTFLSVDVEPRGFVAPSNPLTATAAAGEKPTEAELNTIYAEILANPVHRSVGDIVTISGTEWAERQEYGWRSLWPADSVTRADFSYTAAAEDVGWPADKSVVSDGSGSSMTHPYDGVYPTGSASSGNVGGTIAYTNRTYGPRLAIAEATVDLIIEFAALPTPTGNELTGNGNAVVLIGSATMNSDTADITGATAASGYMHWHISGHKHQFGSSPTQQAYAVRVISRVIVPAGATVTWQPKVHLRESANNLAAGKTINMQRLRTKQVHVITQRS